MTTFELAAQAVKAFRADSMKYPFNTWYYMIRGKEVAIVRDVNVEFATKQDWKLLGDSPVNKAHDWDKIERSLAKLVGAALWVAA